MRNEDESKAQGIQAVVTRVAHYIDARRWAELRSLFADTVETDYTSLFGGQVTEQSADDNPSRPPCVKYVQPMGFIIGVQRRGQRIDYCFNQPPPDSGDNHAQPDHVVYGGTRSNSAASRKAAGSGLARA